MAVKVGAKKYASLKEAGLAALGPYEHYVALTPGATEFTDGPCRALAVTGAGTVNLTTPAGADVNGVPVTAGINPISALKLRAGGTATGVFGLW